MTLPNQSMSMIRASLCLGLVLLANRLVRAEEEPAKLPKDGWWVRYVVTGNDQGNNDESPMKCTYSLVGSANENGQLCRWIEVKSDRTFDGKKQVDTLKFLVPEKELLQSEKPLNSLVRCWRRIDDGDPGQMTFGQPAGVAGTYSSVWSADFAFGRDLIIFPGPQQKLKPVDEQKVIDYQRGRFDVRAGRAGKFFAARRSMPDGRKQSIALDFIVWNDPAVAPGFAAAKTTVDVRVDDVTVLAGTSEWTIEDFGIDAKSAMPDNN
jgi:hypothetical protein